MSRIKNISGVAWLVIGVCVTALVMPTAAFAADTLVKIVGSPSGNKADVSSAGQLLTAAATPANYYSPGDIILTTSGIAIATPPSGDGLVVTSVEVDVFGDPTPGPGNLVEVYLGNSSCLNVIGPYVHAVNPGSVGETDLQFNPGLAVPSGDALCADNGDGVQAEATAIGYTAPAASVPTAPAASGTSAQLPQQK
jgi:hypothetical protein